MDGDSRWRHRVIGLLVMYCCCTTAACVRASVKDWFTTELCVAGKKSTENLIQEALEKVSECAEAAEGALEYMSSHHGIDTCGQSTGLPTGNHHTTVSGHVCVLSQYKTAPTNHWWISFSIEKYFEECRGAKFPALRRRSIFFRLCNISCFFSK